MKFSTENNAPAFDGKRSGKLGTGANPAAVTVKTDARSKEIAAVFKKNGWECVITVAPDKPEDISNLERLLNPPRPTVVQKGTGRNDTCSCGSGKKYKKCCGKQG